MDQSLKLSFWGGTGFVTGANFMLEVSQSGLSRRFLVDCGLIQGSEFADQKNREPFPYDPKSAEFLFVTHAHIDHIGRIPKLVREGFKGRIISTPETKDLSAPMLEDAANLLEEESRRNGVLPIYEKSDIAAALALWDTLPYGAERNFGEVAVLAKDAGHVLGSAMYQFSVLGKKIIFTGDLGNSPSPILRDTEKISGADYLVMESVYGDRNHESRDERKEKLCQAVNRAIAKGGVLLIPSFSLEKTQVILHELDTLIEGGRIKPVPVFLDSPLAIKITEIYKRSAHLFNEAVRKQIAEGDDVFNFPKLRFTVTRSESESIKHIKNPKIIIAGSGMSTGGRITEHEKFYLGDKNNTILFLGYQAAGSPGRAVEEGLKEVSIGGENIKVRAEVGLISGYSSHKGLDDLVDFVGDSAESLKKVFVTMGEPKASLFLAQRLRDYLGVDAMAPEEGETIELF